MTAFYPSAGVLDPGPDPCLLAISECVGDDPGCNEDQQFLLIITLFRTLEQSSDIGQITEKRGFGGREVLVGLEDTTGVRRLFAKESSNVVPLRGPQERRRL